MNLPVQAEALKDRKGKLEYLPLYSTRAGINFQNPTMLSQSLFNQSKSDVLVTEYITRGTIKYLAG